MRLKLEYEKGQSITLDVYDRNFWVGAFPQKSWKIFRGLKRFKSGKALSELEENIYGEDGITIFLNDKQLKPRDISIHTIESQADILAECDYIKGTFMYEQMQTYKTDVEVNRLLEEITDQILQIELHIQKDFNCFSDKIFPIFTPLNYQHLLKNHLLFSYQENKTALPLQAMDSAHLLNEYCNLLRFEIDRSGKENWIILKNPESFLSTENLRVIVKNFEKISKTTQRLKVFFVCDHFLDLDYTYEDIEKTTILGITDEQLPPYDELIRAIKLRHPEEYYESQDVLLKRLYRILPYLGTDTSNLFLFPKDIVLLKILMDMFGYEWEHQKIRIEELSPLEKAFLFKER